MTVRFLDDFDDVGEKAWDALVSKSPTNTIFQTWAWQRAWWHSGPEREGARLYLVALYDDEVLCLLLPLALHGKALKFIGDGSAPVLDLIYDQASLFDLDAVFAPLKAREDWDEIELNAIPDASLTRRYLKVLAGKAGLFPLSMPKQPLWGVLLEGHQERLARFLRSGTMARHAAILSSKGKIECVHAKPGPGKVLPWKELFIQHMHRFSSRAEPSVFASRCARDFMAHLVRDPSLSSRIIFSTLRLNDKPVAYHVGFLNEKIFYSYIFSFDIAYKKFSPDHVLWQEVVAYALGRGCREVIFAPSYEPVVKLYAQRKGAARSIRICRSRREQLARKFSRWHLAAGIETIARECCQILAVLLHRGKIFPSGRQDQTGFDLARDCRRRGSITRPEVELLRRLRPELKDMRMLEMGVAEGGASIYFAPAVKTYSAFDLDETAVAAARASLDDQIRPDAVFLADARDMSFAGEGAYDFIFFSGGRIDEASPEGRVRILAEVRRVGREGAWFFFSSRNLQSLGPVSVFGWADFLRRFRRSLLMSAANQNLKRLRRQPSAMLFDGANACRQAVHYVTPKEQVRALKESGFHDIRIFSSRSGLEVRDWRRWDKLVDDAIYYLCRV